MRTVGSLLLFAFSIPSASVFATELGGEITVATDYMFRGVSQTMSEPALQAGLAAEHDSGWYGWAWVSNVDFVPSGAPDDGADLEANFAVGFSHDFSDSISVNLEGVAYLFPGTKPGYDYDYAEWLLGLYFFGRHQLTFGYSRDVFNVGGIGRYYAAASTFDLTSRVSVDVEIGYYDLAEPLGASYGYAETALNFDSGAFSWRLSYVTSDEGARELFETSTVHNRLVAAVSVAF